jgi:pimeloyl-ACP methyl ester carboxylesterase
VHAAGPSADISPFDVPLVLLPGTLCDARIFAPLLQRLSVDKAHVVLTPTAHTLAEAAEQVLAQAPAHFALLGFSLGGMVAMELAVRAPERVLGLALLSTTPLPVPMDRHASRREQVQQAASLPMSRFLRQHLWPDYGGADAYNGTLPLLEQMAEALGPDAFACQTEQALGRSDFCPRIVTLTCPTLILSGEFDTLCPPAAQRRLAEVLPHATSVLLPCAGHFALIEQADETASAVAAWFHTVISARRRADAIRGVHHQSSRSRETE